MNIIFVERHTHVDHLYSTWIVGATTSKAHIISDSRPGQDIVGKYTHPILRYFLTISVDFLLFLIIDSQKYHVEMEQWKEDLRAARNQVSLGVLSNYRFYIVSQFPVNHFY